MYKFCVSLRQNFINPYQYLVIILFVFCFNGTSFAFDGGSDTLHIIRGDVADLDSGTSTTRVVLIIGEDNLLRNDAPGVGWNQQMAFRIVGTTGGLTANNWGIGAEHAFKCRFPGFGTDKFVFGIEGDPVFPLTFKITKDGYVYLCGRGTITVSGSKPQKLGYDKTKADWSSGLKSKHQLVREGSAEALGWLKAKEALPQLIEALKDSSWEVRRNAVEALGRIGDSTAKNAVLNLSKDTNREVQKVVDEALQRLNSEFEEENLKPSMVYGSWVPGK